LDENGGEEGLLSEVINEKGKAPKTDAEKRLASIRRDPDAADERKALEKYLVLVEGEAAAWKRVTESQRALDESTFAKFSKLAEEDIKSLVVDDKWLGTLAVDVQTELDRVSLALTGRLTQLADRYSKPMPMLEQDIRVLAQRVEAHLTKMGFAWK